MWQIHRLTLWELSRDIHKSRKEEKKSWITVLRNHPDRDISRVAIFLIELALLSHDKRLEEIIDLVT
jgi:hypothetical protein